MEFEWDPVKAEANKKEHDVTFDVAREVFADPLAYTVKDKSHSTDEQRFRTIGQTRNGRLLVVVHTDRDEAIRIITARVASPAERTAYES